MSLPRYSVKQGFISRDIDGELILLDTFGGFVHQINPTGAEIFNLLSMGISIEAIEMRLAEEFELEAGKISQDVLRFVEDLRRAGLVEEED